MSDDSDKMQRRRARGAPQLSDKNWRTVKWGIGHTAVAGGSCTFGLLLFHSINGKAWDALFLKAMTALLTQNGGLSVVLIGFVVATLMMYHNAMTGQVKAKDDEIHRLIEHRDNIERQVGIDHPSSSGRTRTEEDAGK